MANIEVDIVKIFCCSCFYDKYIFLINEKKKFHRTLINDCFCEHFFHNFYNLASKKEYFSIKSHELYHVCYNFLHILCLFHQWKKKYQAQAMLDDICDRTRNMGLRNSCRVGIIQL